MTERYICVHGHFYQPPRENPWLEAIEQQDSARPYHDWNERITAECYATNATARILDDRDRIENIVDNYSRISFNFGPTLLSWMEENTPEVYRALLQADAEGARRYSGHGPAIAQIYNHVIMPLASTRDRRTQIRWGLADFRHRFGRDAEGMWLPETAVDLETLELLAESGIRYTILAPHQAARSRRAHARTWRDVSGARIDPRQSYETRLPSGRRIALFFYDGPGSRAVAFEGLLHDGVAFARRLLSLLDRERSGPQIAHIATDGETYGHHHRYGEMALAYALKTIEDDPSVAVTVYGEYLERHPPTQVVEIVENSSWSCVHGVDRWRRNCGCASGSHPGWSQGWRTPLREALDGLRDALAPRWEDEAGRLLKRPWEARDAYIDVVLDRSMGTLDRFLGTHAHDGLDADGRVRALKLLELQRHAMLMYTSCGWFFDEVSGLETVQVIQYAGRTIQLARETLGIDPEPAFLAKLGEAKSNVPDHKDGSVVYEKFVRPAMVDLGKVAAHYAISSLFETYAQESRIYCYTVERRDAYRMQSGRQQLLVGRAVFTSRITGEAADLSFGVFHFGDHNLQAGTREYRGEQAYQDLVREASDGFSRGEFAEVLRLLDRHFSGATSSLRSLFRDEQRRVVSTILDATLSEAEASMRQIFEHNATLLKFLAGIGMPAPPVLRTVAEFVLNVGLKRALMADGSDFERAVSLVETARREGVTLDAAEIAFAARHALETIADRLAADPRDAATLATFVALAGLVVDELPFDVDLSKAQDTWFRLSRSVLPDMRVVDSGETRAWTERFVALGEKLSMKVD